MTQKGTLFKGQQKKQAAPSRHGKLLKIRKGKVVKAPNKKTDEYSSNKEVTKFINHANEARTATVAVKDGAAFKVLKFNKEQENAKAAKGSGGKKKKKKKEI